MPTTQKSDLIILEVPPKSSEGDRRHEIRLNRGRVPARTPAAESGGVSGAGQTSRSRDPTAPEGAEVPRAARLRRNCRRDEPREGHRAPSIGDAIRCRAGPRRPRPRAGRSTTSASKAKLRMSLAAKPEDMCMDAIRPEPSRRAWWQTDRAATLRARRPPGTPFGSATSRARGMPALGR